MAFLQTLHFQLKIVSCQARLQSSAVIGRATLRLFFSYVPYNTSTRVTLLKFTLALSTHVHFGNFGQSDTLGLLDNPPLWDFWVSLYNSPRPINGWLPPPDNFHPNPSSRSLWPKPKISEQFSTLNCVLAIEALKRLQTIVHSLITGNWVLGSEALNT